VACLHEGDGCDRENIEELAAAAEAELSNAWAQWEPRLRHKTRCLVRNHMHSIEAVALHLMERETLRGAEIDLILEKMHK
jgi:hypothetical protein